MQIKGISSIIFDYPKANAACEESTRRPFTGVVGIGEWRAGHYLNSGHALHTTTCSDVHLSPLHLSLRVAPAAPRDRGHMRSVRLASRWDLGRELPPLQYIGPAGIEAQGDAA
jgi:hypothetical protein